MTNNTPLTSSSSVITAALDILREHGLIVLALAALVWQVWFLANTSREQQSLWRQSIDDMVVEMREDRDERNKTAFKYLTLLSTLEENARVTQILISSVEEACEMNLPNLKPQPATPETSQP